VRALIQNKNFNRVFNVFYYCKRTTAAFYRIENAIGNTAGKIVLIKELKNRTCLQLCWSPAGQYCVLATSASKQSSAGCSVEFVDVQQNDVVSLNKLETEHMTDFEWDPTGRYFCTYISYWNYRVGYLICLV